VRGANASLKPESDDLPTLDIVIVNWNSGPQLANCLDSIAGAAHSGFHLTRVALVDNDSSDGSADRLPQALLPLTVLRNERNYGFAAASNQGATGSAAKYLLFLNPDTRLKHDSLSKPIAFLEQRENSHVGIVGVQLLDLSGRISATCARFLTPGMIARKMLGLEELRIWSPHFMTDWNHQTSATVDHVMGAFFLVRRSLFVSLKGFDERFFVYLEDLDFSLRAKQAGFDSVYLANTQIYHRGGGSSHQIRSRTLYYSLMSRILYGFKHFDVWTAVGLTIGTLLVEPVARIVQAIAHGSPGRILNTVRAYGLLWRGTLTLLRQGRLKPAA
jgi:N-acetylglucosaminyl-diphospho-decaprenol L-rhamnosyltransferase